MKRIPIQKCIYVILVLLIIMMPVFVMGQGDNLGDPGDGGCDPMDPTCPIDGGLSALLVLGAGYGIKKVRDARKAVNHK